MRNARTTIDIESMLRVPRCVFNFPFTSNRLNIADHSGPHCLLPCSWRARDNTPNAISICNIWFHSNVLRTFVVIAAAAAAPYRWVFIIFHLALMVGCFFFPIRVDLRIDKNRMWYWSFKNCVSPAFIVSCGNKYDREKIFNEIMYNIARMHLYVIFENKQYQHGRKKNDRAPNNNPFLVAFFSTIFEFYGHFALAVDGIAHILLSSSSKKKFNEIKIVAINCNRTVIGAECRLIAITWSPPDFTARQKRARFYFSPFAIEKRWMLFSCNLFAPFICFESNHSHQIILNFCCSSHPLAPQSIQTRLDGFCFFFSLSSRMQFEY